MTAAIRYADPVCGETSRWRLLGSRRRRTAAVARWDWRQRRHDGGCEAARTVSHVHGRCGQGRRRDVEAWHIRWWGRGRSCRGTLGREYKANIESIGGGISDGTAGICWGKEGLDWTDGMQRTWRSRTSTWRSAFLRRGLLRRWAAGKSRGVSKQAVWLAWVGDDVCCEWMEGICRSSSGSQRAEGEGRLEVERMVSGNFARNDVAFFCPLVPSGACKHLTVKENRVLDPAPKPACTAIGHSAAEPVRVSPGPPSVL